MTLVELVKEFSAMHGDNDEGWTPERRCHADAIEREICEIVRRSTSKVVTTVVSHGSITLVVDPWKGRVDFAMDRSASFIDSILDPYGKIDRAAQTTQIADFDIAEVAF